jgi:hypothetical protein
LVLARFDVQRVNGGGEKRERKIKREREREREFYVDDIFRLAPMLQRLFYIPFFYFVCNP